MRKQLVINYPENRFRDMDTDKLVRVDDSCFVQWLVAYNRFEHIVAQLIFSGGKRYVTVERTKIILKTKF